MKLSFDVDDSRNSKEPKVNSKGEVIHGFRGRPRLKESLSKRELRAEELKDDTKKRKLTPYISESTKTESPTSTSIASVTNENVNPSVLLNNVNVNVNHFEPSRIKIADEFHIFHDLFPSGVADEQIPSFIDNLQRTDLMSHLDHLDDVRDGNQPDISANGNGASGTKMTDYEENMMIKHFFKRLLPLLDAHPSTPWPQLALKYCDFEIAKSCFIALACIHIYETKGVQEFYRTGMVYVNNTLEYLIQYLKGKSEDSEGDEDTLDVPKIISNLKKQPIEKRRSNFFVILLLIHIHFLFSVVESGRSALVRNFSELFAAIVKDASFKPYLDQIEESSTLIANLSWFDTIAALVSPDCRLPYCDENWYGMKNSPKSLIKLMGCPGEIMRTVSRFCRLRKEMKDNYNIVDLSTENKFNALKYDLLSYRDYVIYQEDISELENYKRLKCAQCWALAVLVNLYKLVKPDDQVTVKAMVNEFIEVYSSMETSSPQITQTIWPIFAIACASTTEYQRSRVGQLLDKLHSTINMGTVTSIKAIATECWETGKTWEEVLAGKEWYGSGIDFLVV